MWQISAFGGVRHDYYITKGGSSKFSRGGGGGSQDPKFVLRNKLINGRPLATPGSVLIRASKIKIQFTKHLVFLFSPK